MTMKLKERVSAVFLFLVFGFAFVYSRKFPDIPKIIPTGITVLGCILSVMLFVRTFYMHYKEDENFNAAALAEQKEGSKKIAIAILMLVVYVGLIKIVGFYTISFVFMIDTEKHKLWTYPVVAIGVLAVIYGIFSMFLQVPLPKGFLI